MIYLRATSVPVIVTLIIPETKRQGQLYQCIHFHGASGIFTLFSNFTLKFPKHLQSFLYIINEKEAFYYLFAFFYKGPGDIVCKLREFWDSII